MKAAVLREVGKRLELEDRPLPCPGPGEVVIALKAAALNRRDFWITQGLYPGIRCPVVLGSDGAGVVSEIGPNVSGTWKGQEVLIQPGMNWGDDARVQSSQFHVVGMPTDGTLAEAIVVRANQLVAKPEHLNWEEAAALPLAGLTAYRAAIVQAGVEACQRVLVTGAGGGVATFAAQFAHAVGARVFVTSSSCDKIDAAIRFGAVAGYDYRDDDWSDRLRADHGLMDVIIDGAGGPNYNRLLGLIAPGGSIVNYGATAGRPKDLDLFRLFWKQARIQGSTLGSPADFEAMLRLVCRCRLRPAIDVVLTLDDVNDGLERMSQSTQFGKIVVRL